MSRASDLAELHSTKMDERKSESREKENVYKMEKSKPQTKQYHLRTQPKTTATKPKLICFRCGYEGHSGYRCMRSRNVVCSVWHMCRVKAKHKVNYVDENSEIQDGNENEDISGVKHVFQVTDFDSNNVETLIEGKSVKVILDSGASVNCMNKDTYNSLKTSSTKLEKLNTKIYPYASEIPLKLPGVSHFNIVVNGKVYKINMPHDRWPVKINDWS